jgi:hypothetical protein
VEGVELLLEAGRVPEPPLIVERAQRRGAAVASHLGAVPCHVSSRVRAPSTPTSFCLKTPASPCPRELWSEALAGPPRCRHAGPMRRSRRLGFMCAVGS